MGFRSTPRPTVNSFTNPTLGSLRYNTAQMGSPIPLVWGTQRLGVNLLEFWGYQQHNVGSGKWGGKGGGGGKSSSGGKKGGGNPPQFTVFVAFGVCQGPAFFYGQTLYGQDGANRVWANAGIGYGAQALGLNTFSGYDGQPVDPAFAAQDPNQPSLGYSGTAVAYGSPMDLGTSAAIPNVSFEIIGFGAGTAGGTFPDDCDPSWMLNDFLTNPRYGAGFPSWAIDQNSLNDFTVYCQAVEIAISKVLDSCEAAARTIEEICALTVVAPLWSGARLKFIPYAAVNIANWSPNVAPIYDVGDNEFIAFGGDSDPVQISVSDPAHIHNWLSVEYQDRRNSYNNNVVYDFDQAAIDLYGVKPTAASDGHCLCNASSALASAQFQLMRLQSIRNTFKFQLPWTFALLEPMDVITITDPVAGLFGVAVRITGVSEDDQNVLIFDAEELRTAESTPPPRQTQVPNPQSPQIFATPGAAI